MAKKRKGTRRIKAMVDMASALRNVFQDYSINTRREAWKSLTSEKGQKEMKKLLRTPKRSLNTIRTLWSESFKEFMGKQI